MIPRALGFALPLVALAALDAGAAKNSNFMFCDDYRDKGWSVFPLKYGSSLLRWVGHQDQP